MVLVADARRRTLMILGARTPARVDQSGWLLMSARLPARLRRGSFARLTASATGRSAIVSGLAAVLIASRLGSIDSPGLARFQRRGLTALMVSRSAWPGTGIFALAGIVVIERSGRRLRLSRTGQPSRPPPACSLLAVLPCGGR
jgi:hypothetical protein